MAAGDPRSIGQKARATGARVLAVILRGLAVRACAVGGLRNVPHPDAPLRSGALRDGARR